MYNSIPNLFYNHCAFVHVDDSFGIWTGGLAYPGEHTAILAAVVIGGHHPNSTYVWSRNGGVLEIEQYPIIYITYNGMYTCTIDTKFKSGISVTHTLQFVVEGM